MSITGSSGTRAISKRYPITSGIIAETTTQVGRKTNLVPTLGTNVLRRNRVGL